MMGSRTYNFNHFLVVKIDRERLEGIMLHEGQKWALMDQDEFFARDDVVVMFKDRFRDYLESRQ